MTNKILAFITDGKEFLALKNNSQDPSHGGDFWFTVTGAIEEETQEEAVAREVKEETGLKVKKIIDLNWKSNYLWKGEECEESNFLVLVNKKDITLNEEHTAYKWLKLKDFIELIGWDDDKKVLLERLNRYNLEF